MTEFQEFYELERGNVIRFFAARGVAPSEAEDLAQETFIRIWVHWPTIHAAARFNYLWVTARRLAIDWSRRFERRNIRFDPALHDGVVADVTDQLLQAEQLLSVRQAVSQLPEQYQRAVRWVYYDEVPLRERAAQAGTTRAAIKSMALRARRKLRPLLQEAA